MELFANRYVFAVLLIFFFGLGAGITHKFRFVTERFKNIWYGAYFIILLASIFLTETFAPMQKAFWDGELIFAYSFAVGAVISLLIMSYLAALLLTVILKIHKAIDKED